VLRDIRLRYRTLALRYSVASQSNVRPLVEAVASAPKVTTLVRSCGALGTLLALRALNAPDVGPDAVDFDVDFTCPGVHVRISIFTDRVCRGGASREPPTVHALEAVVYRLFPRSIAFVVSSCCLDQRLHRTRLRPRGQPEMPLVLFSFRLFLCHSLAPSVSCQYCLKSPWQLHRSPRDMECAGAGCSVSSPWQVPQG
jgi:hypothetical protein